MSRDARPPRETRSDFAHVRPITTRWADEDVYGHVNNVVYQSFFDTVVAGFDLETGVRYFAPIAFPDRIAAGLRVAGLGRSNVRYEIRYKIGILRDGDADAQGHFIHVYVDRETRRPVPLPANWRADLEGLVVPGRDDDRAPSPAVTPSTAVAMPPPRDGCRAGRGQAQRTSSAHEHLRPV